MLIVVTGCATDTNTVGGARHGRPAQPIVGMTPDAVQRLLGEPALRRREPPGDYWRYAIDGCALGLFFFTDPQTHRERVTWYDARSMLPGVDRCADLRASLGPPAARQG